MIELNSLMRINSSVLVYHNNGLMSFVPLSESVIVKIVLKSFVFKANLEKNIEEGRVVCMAN